MSPRSCGIPTISIGGGPGCSGQLLVTPDVLGMFDAFTPSFAKKYQDFNGLMKQTFAQYAEGSQKRRFPRRGAFIQDV